jgi:hypothetical protein
VKKKKKIGGKKIENIKNGDGKNKLREIINKFM